MRNVSVGKILKNDNQCKDQLLQRGIPNRVRVSAASFVIIVFNEIEQIDVCPRISNTMITKKVYVFQMPKFYTICSVWILWEFFVSHCILRGLRQPLYLFFFLCISPSLPFLPLSLQPETLLPKTSFFPKRQTRLCQNPRIH